MLIALGALFLFIGQQDDIGTGGYTVRQAALFVALNLPSYVADLLPVAALIGTLLGLGHLANGSELVVMRVGRLDAAVLSLARDRGCAARSAHGADGRVRRAAAR